MASEATDLMLSDEDFEDIRPYQDSEVPEVIRRLGSNKDFISVLATSLMPSRFSRSLVGRYLSFLTFKWQTRSLCSVEQCQDLMSKYFEKLVTNTMEGMTVDGLDKLEKNRSYLFISNHRDIVLDSACLNYFLRQSGHQTARVAVGDNLFSWPYAADLMRVNKSFIVKRGAPTSRERYRQMVKTSEFVWRSINQGHSVWIAQKEGRSKDGYDRTDPAVLKMLGLAHKEHGGVGALPSRVLIVPVAISYEIDPCAIKKAHELSQIEREGFYEKSSAEDLESMLLGIVGYKGRVHLSVTEPIEETLVGLDELCSQIDRQIVSDLKIYPTHSEAAFRLSLSDKSFEGLGSSVMNRPNEALQAMLADLSACPQEEQPFFLLQYANLIKNGRDLFPGL